MEAGQELDALVAEKIMGWRYLNQPSTGYPWYPPEEGWSKAHPPRYSTDIAAAWKVMEKMCDMGNQNCTLQFEGKLNPDYAWTFSHDENADWWASAGTAPLAICLAALKVKGVDV